MKKILSSLFLSLSLIGTLVVFAPVVHADVDCTNPDFSDTEACSADNPCGPASPSKDSVLCAETKKSGNPILGPDGILTAATGFVSWLIGIASIFVILVGAIRYVTAGGDANSVSAAKKMIIYALIGIVVAIFARAVVILVLK